MLTTHKDRLVELAEKLVAEETIETEEFEAMFADLPPKGRGSTAASPPAPRGTRADARPERRHPQPA